MNDSRLPPISILLSCLLGLGVLFGLAHQNLDNVFRADEPNYVRAIELGLAENWWEANALDTVSFLKQGYAAFVGAGDIKLWHRMLQEGDVMALRHFHGGFAYLIYGLSGTAPATEVGLRGVSLAIGSLLIISIAAFGYLLIPGVPFVVSGTLLVATACYLLFSSQVLFVSPHLLYGLSSFVALGLCALSIRRDSRSLARLSWVFAGVCASTLEYAPVLIAVLFGATILRWRFAEAVKGLLLVALTMLVCWPAGVLKLKLLVSYAKYSYAALFSNYYRRASDSVLLQDLGLQVFCGLLVFGATVAGFRCWKVGSDRWLLVFLAYGLLMFGLNLSNNFVYQPYVLSFVPSLVLTAMFGLSHFWTAQQRPILRLLFGLVLAGILLVTFSRARTVVAQERQRDTERRNFLQESATQLAGFARVFVLGYPDYVAERYLGSGMTLVQIDSDIESTEVLADQLGQTEATALLVMGNTGRVLTKVTPTELAQFLEEACTPIVINRDFKICRRRVPAVLSKQ